MILTNLATNVVAAQLEDVNGSFNLPNLQADDYELQISAPDHLDYTQNVTVQPGATTQLDAYLPQSVYSFVWTVVPVTETDSYEIELTSTFVTDVPVPVVTVDPDPLDFSSLAPGQTEVIDATITNHSLIAPDNLNLNLPDPNGFVITPEENDIPFLAAESSIDEVDEGFEVSFGSVTLGLALGGLDIAVDPLRTPLDRPVAIDLRMPSDLAMIVLASLFIGARSQTSTQAFQRFDGNAGPIWRSS